MKKSNKIINIQKQFQNFKEYSWDFNKMIRYRRRKWLSIKLSNNLVTSSQYKVLNKKSFRSYKFISQNIFKAIFAKNLSKRQTKKLFRVNYRYTSTTKRILKSEYRFDTLVYRLYYLPSIESARVLILNGFFILNGYVNSKPQTILEPGSKIKPSNFLSFSFFYVNLLKNLSTLKKYLNRVFFKFSYPFIIRQKKQLINEHGKKHKHNVVKFMGKRFNINLKKRVYKKKYLSFKKSSSKKIHYMKYKLKNKKNKRLKKKVIYFMSIKLNYILNKNKIVKYLKKNIKYGIRHKNKNIKIKCKYKNMLVKLKKKKIGRHLKKKASIRYFTRKQKYKKVKKIKFYRLYKKRNKLKKNINLVNKNIFFNLIKLNLLKRKRIKLIKSFFFKKNKLVKNKNITNIFYRKKKKLKFKFKKRMKKPNRIFSFYRLSKKKIILIRYFKSFNNNYRLFKTFKNYKNIKWNNLIKSQFILEKKIKKIKKKHKSIVIPFFYSNIKKVRIKSNIVKIVKLKKKYIRISNFFRRFLSYKIKINLNQYYTKTIKIKYKELNLQSKNRPVVYYFIETNFITLEHILINDIDILNYPHQTFLNFKFLARLFGPRN